MNDRQEVQQQVLQGLREEKSFHTTWEQPNDHDKVVEKEHRQNRLSAYSFSDLPEVVPVDTYDGKVVVPRGDKETVLNNEKEIVHVETLPEPCDEEHSKEAIPLATKPPVSRKSRPVKERLNRRFCGIRAKWVLLGLTSMILLTIILGVGIGVGLRSGGASIAQVDSRSGAFNGTKIALVTQKFATDGQGGSEESLVMYFQHWTGQIRWMRLDDTGEWVGGDSTKVVAINAKNNTPISAVSYVWNGVSFWRVFYIDSTNLIREVWAGNNTQGWATGPLSYMSVSPMDDDRVGMVACWYGPTAPEKYAEGFATTTNASQLAIRLVYAKDATTFQEMNYRGDTQVWTPGQTLPDLNGHATPACYNRGQGTVDYLMVVDLQNSINVYWRETDTNHTSTTSNAVNQWTNASIAISNVEDSATLGYTKFLYAQDRSDKLIRAYNVSFAAEYTTLDTNSGFVVQGSPGLHSTGLGVTARPDAVVGGDDVLVLYQTDGSDISYYEREADDISWNSANIRVPL